MADEAAQIPEPFNVHAWLVKPSGFGAGVTFTQDRKLTVLEAEWEWLAKGGSGPAMVKVEGDLGDPDTYVTNGWEIVLDIRLQPEVNYTRWYRGRIVDVKAAVVSSKTVTTIRVQGQWAAEATNVKIDNDYTAGTQDVKTIIGDIIDTQGVDAQTRIVYDASLIAASTYTPTTFDAVGSASRVIAALAETQGSREFDVDPDTRKFRMAAEVTTVAERNIYIVGKDVKELDSGDAHDRGTNTIVVTGRNDGGQARTSEVGDAADQTSYGKKMRHVILPYMSATADLTRWANNQISDLKGRQEYSIFEIPDVQSRVEGTAPPIGNIKLWRRKSDGTSDAVSLPLHKVRYSYGVACDADYDQPECTPGEIRPRGRTIKALVFIGTPPPNLPEWNEKIELEKERISIWIQQGQVPDKYAGDPTNNLPEGRQWTEKLVADSTNKDLYLCTNTTGPTFVRIGGQNLAFKDEANAFTQENSFGSQKLTSVADPTAAQDVATKAYVDAVAIGIDWKPSVRVATTGNITLSGEQTIDGVAAVAGDRVLVKDQTSGATNGIYVVAAGAWARSTDADTSAEVTGGLAVFINEGTANGNRGWILTTNDPITLGTTVLVFTQFLGPGADDHGQLTGLADDDHTQYLRTDGTRTLTGNMAVNAGITIDGRDLSVDGVIIDDAARKSVANTFTANQTLSGASTDRKVMFSRTGDVTATAEMYIDANGNFAFGATSAHAMLFLAGNSEFMRITSVGNIGIFPGKKINLDGVIATGDTYITEASPDVIHIVQGNNVHTLPATAGALAGQATANTFTSAQTFNENISMAALKTVDGRDISADGVIIDDAARKSVANTFTANQTLSKSDPQLILVNTDAGGDSWQLEVGDNADTPTGAFKINETGVGDRLVIDPGAMGIRATSDGWMFGDAAGTPAAEIHLYTEAPQVRFQSSTAAFDTYDIRAVASLEIYNVTDARVDLRVSDAGVVTIGDVGGEDELVITPGTGATVSGDIDAAGGFRNHVNFMQFDVAASQTTAQLYRDTNNNFWMYPMVRSGSITGIAVGVTNTANARTAGTLTVEAYIYSMTLGGGAVATGLQAILDGTNTKFKATTQAKGTDTFSAGQAILCYITTSADWAPTTADIVVTVEYEA